MFSSSIAASAPTGGSADCSAAAPSHQSRARERVRSRRYWTHKPKQKQAVTVILSIGLLLVAADLLLSSTGQDILDAAQTSNIHGGGLARRLLLAKRYVRSNDANKPKNGFGTGGTSSGGGWKGSVAGADTRPKFPNMPSGEAIAKRQKLLGIETEEEKEERERQQQEGNELLEQQHELEEEPEEEHGEKQEIERQKTEILYAETPSSERPYLKLRAHPGGRIGNDLFAYASSYALSKAYSYNLCLMTHTDDWQRRQFKLEDYFVGPFASCDPQWETTRTAARQIGTVHTDKMGLFWDDQKTLRDLTLSDRHKDLEIGGHLQRYGNFDMYLNEILESLTFKEDVRSSAREIIGRHREEGTVLVAIHARRGDMKDSELYNPGPAYYQQAIDQMRSEIAQRAINGGDNPPRIKFLVLSEGDEGRSWFESNHVEGGGIFSPMEDFEYVGSDDAMLDLAVLSACDHSIISGGTYSFWSALLAARSKERRNNGVVITSNDNYGLPEGWILIEGGELVA